MKKQKPLVESITDSMGNTVVIGDYVLANVRDYHRNVSSMNSGSSRKMVRGFIKEFVGAGKVRLTVDNDVDAQYHRSWVSENHVTLLAPAEMAEGYKDAFQHYTQQKGE
jgi:hypothetical protein